VRITPLDVRNHVFPRRMNGYDREEVDTFLRMVSGDYEIAMRELQSAREKIGQLEQRVTELLSNERLLQETLTTAQHLSQDLKQTAMKEAEMMISEAEIQGEKVLDAAHRRAARLAEDLREMKLLRGRVAAYQIDLENEIYFSPLTFSNINLEPTRRRGLELESSWRATQTVDLRAGFAWIDARFRSGVYNGTDVSGNKVPLVPERLASGGVSWRFTPQSRANLSARYVGRQRFDNDQDNTHQGQQPSYAVADLKLEQRVARWDLALEVRNLFNRKYFSYGTATSATSFSALPATGIAAYASVGYRLD